MRFLSAMLLLLAVSARAQVIDADVAVRVQPLESPARPGQNLTWVITALNLGPAHAQDVVVTVALPGEVVNIPPFSLACTNGHPIRCTIPILEPNSTSGVAFINGKAPAAPGTYFVTATISSSTHDPNPGNNTVELTVIVSDVPDASVSLVRFPTDRILAGEHRVVRVGLGTGSRVLHDARVTLEATGATVASIEPPPGFTCAGAVCTASVFGPQSGGFLVELVAPDRDDGGTVTFEADVRSSDPDFNPNNNHALQQAFIVKRFPVTTIADSGAGSLRQAIVDASRSGFSAPGQIVFRLPAPVVIRPETPLPPLSGIVSVDGSQGVEIRGDLQREGDGLTIDDVCEVRVSGLTIDGFPRNGINIGGARLCGGVEFPPVIIENNEIRANERGIGGSGTDTVWINGNVIGDNRRSAIFLYGGRVAEIRDNFIGVTRDGAAAPNGASGIYVALFSADITNNVIANNGDFGIAVSAFAPAIGIRQNRIFGNGQTAIDVGLDLESPNGDDTQRAMLNHPVLIDAHYDPAAKKTIVRGHYETQRNNGNVVVEIFSSSSLNARGHAEARQFLGRTTVASGHDFEFAADGDLTGQFIAATATVEDFLTVVRDVTSELSAPVQVSP